MQSRAARLRKAAAPKPAPDAETRSVTSDVPTQTATPIEVMLGTMRALWQSSRDGEGRVVDAKTAAAAASLAKDAAPYVHPRLATVDAPVESGFGRMSDAELEERIRRLLSAPAEASCAKD
jgi:hypothetical protein